MASKVILQSLDFKNFPVEVDVARMSNTIKKMMEDLGLNPEGRKDEVKIPLPNVRGEILKLVVQWLMQHRDDPVTSEQDDDSSLECRTDDIPPWDAEFLDVEQHILFDLILAANYLDIKGLLDVACKTVANIMKEKKTPEAIRKCFQIKNDFTQSEEEQIRKENEWCEEK